MQVFDLVQAECGETIQAEFVEQVPTHTFEPSEGNMRDIFKMSAISGFKLDVVIREHAILPISLSRFL